MIALIRKKGKKEKKKQGTTRQRDYRCTVVYSVIFADLASKSTHHSAPLSYLTHLTLIPERRVKLHTPATVLGPALRAHTSHVIIDRLYRVLGSSTPAVDKCKHSARHTLEAGAPRATPRPLLKDSQAWLRRGALEQGQGAAEP